MRQTPQALTIAGSDSGGGAGIQADLKTMTMLGVFGTSVITALTAQNTREVRGVEAPSPGFVANQLAAVLDDFDIRAAKTGMLYSAPIVSAVADGLAKSSFPLVVDPVCVSQSGAKLLDESALDTVKERLLPMAALVTPNVPEAELLTGLAIRDRDDILEALARILEMGPKAVLIKGGHLDTPAVTDWYAESPDKPLPLMQRRVPTESLHGTGCTLAAAVASHLALGAPMDRAVREAQKFLHLGLRSAPSGVGRGAGPVNHMAILEQYRAVPEVMERLYGLGRRLGGLEGLGRFAPDGGSEAVAALPYADDPGEMVGFRGRLFRVGDGELTVPGRVELGGAPEVSTVLAAARRRRPDLRFGLSLGGGGDVQSALRRSGAVVLMFDWSEAAGQVPPRTTDILSWGASKALDEADPGEGPLAVGHGGALGVEAKLFLLAESGEDMLELLASASSLD